MASKSGGQCFKVRTFSAPKPSTAMLAGMSLTQAGRPCAARVGRGSRPSSSGGQRKVTCMVGSHEDRRPRAFARLGRTGLGAKKFSVAGCTIRPGMGILSRRVKNITNACGGISKTTREEFMLDDNTFEDINEAKANMDHIYDQADPRAYFRELKKLGYAIPGVAKPIFQQLIAHLQDRQERAVRVLDLGCSYGVNAALLKHDLSMPDLYDHGAGKPWSRRHPSR